MLLASLESALRYPSIHRAQWQSRRALEELQWRRFKRVLETAYHESPFYRRRFDEVGIRPDSIRDRGDLERIPITTREDLRHPDDLICHRRRQAGLHSSLTTGSTGRRTRTYFDDRAWLLAKYLLKLRARLATGVSLSDRIALLQESDTVEKRTPWRDRLPTIRSFSIDLPTGTLLEKLRDFGPDVLYGFPSHLRRLATEVSGGFAISRIYTSGEQLVGETKHRVEGAFGAPVLDVYGCTEVKEIAWQCLEQDGYHINSDWLLVEVEDGDAQGGPEGPILVTALYNHAMPVIRYRVGDTGVLLEESCRCGRGLPLMRPTGGRTVDYFQLPDGTSVSPYAMTSALERVPGMKQFQLLQLATDRVAVRAVADPARRPTIEDEIRASLAGLLSSVELEIDLVDRIDPDRTGKFRVVSSRIGAAE